MIRTGNEIRLTADEAGRFTSLTGFPAPSTVWAYNRLLGIAAASVSAEGTPEGRLMAAIIEDEMLDVEASSARTGSVKPLEMMKAAMRAALMDVRVKNGRVERHAPIEKRAFVEITGFEFPRTLRQIELYRQFASRNLLKSL